MSNVLRIYDWEALIEALTGRNLAAICAFMRSDTLYSPGEWRRIFDDADVRALLQTKFEILANAPIVCDAERLRRFLLWEHGSPLAELHDDATIFASELYLAASEGIFRARAHRPRRLKRGVDKTAARISDLAAVAVQARHGYLAIAASVDGLFELLIRPEERLGRSHDATCLTSSHTAFVNWAFTSIYGSSDVAGGHLAVFRWDKQDDTDPYARLFEGILDDREIAAFAHARVDNLLLSWAVEDKVYLASDSRVHVCRYVQKYAGDVTRRGEAFEFLGEIAIPIGQRVVMATAAAYGTIIELDDRIVVIRSDDEITTILRAPVRWRTVPRAKYYENHLHVITDTSLDIYSFNHDYFIDQQGKLIGSRVRA